MVHEHNQYYGSTIRNHKRPFNLHTKLDDTSTRKKLKRSDGQVNEAMHGKLISLDEILSIDAETHDARHLSFSSDTKLNYFEVHQTSPRMLWLFRDPFASSATHEGESG